MQAGYYLSRLLSFLVTWEVLSVLKKLAAKLQDEKDIEIILS